MPYKKGVSGKSPLQEKKTLFTFSDTHNDRVRKTPPSFPQDIEAFPKKTATFPKKDATFSKKYHYRFKNIYIRKSKNITFYIPLKPHYFKIQAHIPSSVIPIT